MIGLNFSTLSRNFSFLDLDPVEIARQLTRQENEMYRMIHPKECLDYIGPDKETKCPNIMRMIKRCWYFWVQQH